MKTYGTRNSGLGTRLIVGFGATGLSVARHLTREGVPFAVTDSRDSPDRVQSLAALGTVPCAFGAFASPLPLADLAEAIVSPGVSLDEPFVRELQAAGVPVVGDIELFARAVSRVPSPESRVPAVVGITGSNGKSTVTTLLGEMARAAEIHVAVGGNLGPPALDLLGPQVQLYVVELSSFQLQSTRSLRCTAATVLNVSEDHLDRHRTLDAYASAKTRVFAGAGVAVVNRDDLTTHRSAHLARRIVSFGLDAPENGHYGLVAHQGEEWLVAGTSRLLPMAALRMFGRHNAANALAALALAEAADIALEPALAALTAFRGLPHRCQWVAERDGVAWYNDSKGTNVGAALAALQGLDGPLVWLGGGQSKGQDFAPLRAPLARKARLAVVFGEDAALLEQTLSGAVPLRRVRTLDEAVAEARHAARGGDKVLLSPACASLDQFQDYAARGDRFIELVQREVAA